MKLNFYLILIAVFTLVTLSNSKIKAQIPTDSWRDHLPYNHATQVAFADSKIYCATESALFYLNKEDNSINRKNKINGMSDLGIGSIAYSEEFNTLVVGYTNGNIDLIIGDSIINISDLKDKNILAVKTINKISIFNNYAYLSCGFGIVIINLEKREVADTYVIGPNSSYMKINYVGKLNDELFALTEFGIYKAKANNQFLSYYKNWSLDTTIPNYNSEFISGTVIHNRLYATTENDRKVYAYDGSEWNDVLNTTSNNSNLSSANNQLIVTDKAGCASYNEALKIQQRFNTDTITLKHSLIDNNNIFWCANKDDGLMKVVSQDEVYNIYPNGPENINVFSMQNNAGEILVAHGGYNNVGANTWKIAEFFHFAEENWMNFNKNDHEILKDMRDVITFASTGTKGSYYVGTWAYGVIQMENNEIKTIYNEDNSEGTILTIPNGSYGGVSGMDFDKNGNLWLLQRNSIEPFIVKTAQGDWYSYSYNQHLSKVNTRNLINTKNDNFWCFGAVGKGILVFNANGTPENKSDDNYRHFRPIDTEGTSVDNDIRAIVEDKEGAIWLGTADGIAVYDYPNNIIIDSSMRARIPQVVIDGYLNPLLGGTLVTSIVVDGGNRKWIGTAGGGLFLVSPDGTEQVLNLNASNSPLFSDNILALALNPENGELFIGTDLGILSYMTSSSESKASFSDVYAFPNPVREGYNGLITIRGLIYETQVKITDIAGKLVYSAQSQGGDIVWNGQDMSGNKVQTGIYLVLASNSDGSEAEVTKILFVR